MRWVCTLVVGITFAFLGTACGGGAGGLGDTVGVGSGGGSGGSGGGAPPAPGSGDVMSAAEEQYAMEVLVLSNQERQQAGVPALAYDVPASQVAYDHCLFQQAQGFISHEGPGGNAPWDRLTGAGIGWSTAGENVAVGQPTPASVVQAWVNSPGHYANMINANFTNLGMGVQEGPGGIYGGPWWTQLFYRP